ncbi:mitochondrial import receptor subunit TOM7 homolog isoform X1 [Ovis aries]|uniref:mitochondrial import receptor subunit TOM7 homolog isoform X1 n=1 Tax=Ovis aries TaxID=9940 RepID=UPI0029526C59|nr:mitochondrial import receptor subunit TOM7 homolog isoform X1 [Ovis aries]
MVKLSKEAKQRLQQLFKGGQFAIRWGFIPLVIYLGFKRGADPGMPEPTVLRIAATASKSLQSYLTLCNPIDGSPPGSPVPGILQVRTLEWVAISFSNALK